jgi:hypothetical protein
MKIYKWWLLLIAVCTVSVMQAQNVGVGTNNPHSSSILDIQSTNKGASLPSMTTSQRLNINNPKPGLLVFDIDKSTIYMFDGGQWLALLFSATDALVPPTARVPSDGNIGDQFGFTVAISGNYAVIGSPYDNVGANVDQGCVYIFQRTASVWSEQVKLTASDGGTGDQFGYAVAISSAYVIVGAPMDNSPGLDVGSAYVFFRNGSDWSEQAKLTASNAATGDHFGFSVSISGAYAAIGAKDDDVGADVDEGSAYVFFRTGTSWAQQDNVIAPFGAADDHYGYSIGISGDYLVVGANEDDVSGVSNAGSAHVYLRNVTNWEYQDDLVTEGTGNEDDHFGESVAIDGNYIVVGKPYNPTYVGALAFVYIRSGITWNHQATLSAQPQVFSAPVNQFGISVSIEGDYVIIGSNHTIIGDDLRRGAAYLFKRDGTSWIFVRRIDDTAGGYEHLLGSAVGVSGLNCVVGAPNVNAQRGKIVFLNFQ